MFSWRLPVTLVVILATRWQCNQAQQPQVLTSNSANVSDFVVVKVRPNLGPQEKQPLTPGLQRDLLDDHNNKRRTETNMGALGVENLIWDADLAKSAQAVAASCNFQHTQPGQNFYASSPAGGQPISPQAVNTWYEEKKVYDYDTNTCSGKCGQYLQIVWDDTTHVGCGYMRCEKLTEGPNELFGGKAADFLVCHYNPVGNVVPDGESEPRRPFQRSTDPCTTKPIDCGLTGKRKVEGDACVCDCFPGFTGPTCKTDLCDHCSIDGTDYTKPGSGKCDCVCLPGFSGTDCDNDVCEVCQNEGFGDPVRSNNGCDCQCWTGFSGPDCTIECPPNCAECTSSTICTECIPNFEVDSSGGCVAQSPCETSTIACLNGNKGVRLFDCVCECNDGFSGDQCEKDHCAECDQTGTATRIPGDKTCACTCKDGYTGDKCQTACPANCVSCTDEKTCTQCSPGLDVDPATGICVALDACDRSRLDCGDHGKQVVSGDNCVCQCDHGFSGEDCKTDECATCYTFGTASTEPGEGSCRCNCKTGFSGNNCSTDVCAQCVLEGTGMPVRSATSCRCKCFDGFVGENCQTDLCDDCDPFGTEELLPSGQDCMCKCYLGYSGPYCETDECTACEDEGFGDAVRTGAGCDCQCWRGFSGQNCDIECSANCAECLDKNTCIECNPGYRVDDTTKRCVVITPCDTSTIVCENDGKKVVRGNDCVCQCPRGYGGDRCQTDHCATCSLKGTAHKEPGEDKCTCTCHPGFSDDKCNTDICATCVQQGNGTPVRSFQTCDCQCNPGFVGDNCENSCPTYCVKCSRTGVCTQCQPGFKVAPPGCQRRTPCELSTIQCGDQGTKVVRGDTCVCNCKQGWAGALCDERDRVMCEQVGGKCRPFICPKGRFTRDIRYPCVGLGQVCCIPRRSSTCENAGNRCMRQCRRGYAVDTDPSHTCNPGRTCCVRQISECENIGGQCRSECRGARPMEDNRFDCESGRKCCIKHSFACLNAGGLCLRQCRRNRQPDNGHDCGQDRTCCVRHISRQAVSSCTLAKGRCMSECRNNQEEDKTQNCDNNEVCCVQKPPNLPECREVQGRCLPDCSSVVQPGFVYVQEPNHVCSAGRVCCVRRDLRKNCQNEGGRCRLPSQCATDDVIPEIECPTRGNRQTVCCRTTRG